MSFIGLNYFCTTFCTFAVTKNMERPVRRQNSDNVHLDFLLGSVRRKSKIKRKQELASKASLPASREGTIGNYSPQAKERWNRAREAISRGYLIFRTANVMMALVKVKLFKDFCLCHPADVLCFECCIWLRFCIQTAGICILYHSIGSGILHCSIKAESKYR